MNKKTGILLTQLGTPKAPTTSAVRPYLTQFLNDPRVIDIPTLLRLILVNLIIVPFRAPKSAKIYQELWEEGGGESPLLTYTAELTNQLNSRLNGENIFVHMAMRYQEPSMDKVLEKYGCSTMTASLSSLCFRTTHPQFRLRDAAGNKSSRNGGSSPKSRS